MGLKQTSRRCDIEYKKRGKKKIHLEIDLTQSYSAGQRIKNENENLSTKFTTEVKIVHVRPGLSIEPDELKLRSARTIRRCEKEKTKKSRKSRCSYTIKNELERHIKNELERETEEALPYR